MVDAGEVLLDFTARQFDEKAPYPLIVTRKFAERNFVRANFGPTPTSKQVIFPQTGAVERKGRNRAKCKRSRLLR
jgi:hypothetical protein